MNIDTPSRMRENNRAVPSAGRDEDFAVRPAPKAIRADAAERTKRLGMVRLLLSLSLPVLLAAIWLFGFAADQFQTEFRFAIRHHAPPQAAAPTTATMLAGTNPMLSALRDSEMLVQYINSRQAVDDSAARIDLAAIYGSQLGDWWTRLSPGEPVEDRVKHWRRMVDASLDMTSGLVTVRVRAFDPASAQAVAASVLSGAELLVNGISRRSQDDALRLTAAEVARAEARLGAARQRLTAYRNEHGLLSPQMQASVQSTVLSRLREMLAEARAAYATRIASGIPQNEPQTRLQFNRIVSLEEALRSERAELARPMTETGQPGTLASVSAGYAVLEGEEQIARLAYERALTSETQARLEAISQSVYLDAFVQPSLPERSTYPRRWLLLAQIALGTFVAWCIGSLIWKSFRDHI